MLTKRELDQLEFLIESTTLSLAFADKYVELFRKLLKEYRILREKKK